MEYFRPGTHLSLGFAELSVGIGSLGLRIGTDGTAQVLAVTRQGGGLSSLSLTEGAAPQVLDQVFFPSSLVLAPAGELTLLDQGGLVVAGRILDGTPLVYTLDAAGGLDDVSLLAPAGVPKGQGAVLSAFAEDTTVLARLGEGRISTLSPDGTRRVQDTGAQITALQVVARDSARFVLSLDGADAGVRSYRVDNEGRLQELDRMGAGQGLGIMPVAKALAQVTLAGETYAVVGSASGTGQGAALSVLRVGSGGGLMPTDHVLDTLNTRFGALQTLSVIEAQGVAYVIAGGGDDGLSLFMLLPDGRLVHQHSLVHATGLGLENIETLTALRLGGEIQVVVGAQSTPGLMQFIIDLPDQRAVLGAGVGGENLRAGGGDDIVMGGAGDDRLQGGAGDDLLLDGAGADTLEGGAGADLFVLLADGAPDRIVDFDPAQDRLDLSDYPMLYDPSQLVVTSTAYGAVLTGRGEVLDLYGIAGRLTQTQVLNAIRWGADRPMMVVNVVQTGSAGRDTLSGAWGSDQLIGLAGSDSLTGGEGDDALWGGDGYDTILAGGGHDRVTGGNGRDWVDMGDGDDLFSDNAQAGRHGRDTVFGGLGRDTVQGGGGDDLAHGDGDNDLLLGRKGSDTLIGGAGNDTLEGGDGTDSLQGDNGADVLRGGALSDTLRGGDGDDRLYGNGQDDLIFAGTGADTVNGGNGRDRVYLGAGDDLFQDNAQAGQYGSDTIFAEAGNDTVEGGGGDDLAYGQQGDDRLNGRLGHDRLYGGDGDDTLDGGSGNDTMAGGAGRDRGFMGGGDDLWLDDAETGALGSDLVVGDAGRDTIHSLGGEDTLLGGGGADTFIFTAGAGARMIVDFDPTEDLIQLTGPGLSPAEISLIAREQGLFLTWQDGSILLADLGAGQWDSDAILWG